MYQLLKELQKINVRLALVGDDLEIIVSKEGISKELVEKLKKNKSQLVSYLKRHSKDVYDTIPQLEKRDNYPVSSSQYRLWILSQVEENSIAYNIIYHTLLNGNYKFPIFKDAISAVIRRHESLRTVFGQDDLGNVYQQILDFEQVNLMIEYKDVSVTTSPEENALSIIEADYYIPFNLSNGPLLRIKFIRINEDKVLLYFNMHHIIADGWSMQILARDIKMYYNAFESNTSPILPELTIQYKEYASWQLSQVLNKRGVKAEKYWISKLSGQLPQLDLPSFKNRPKHKTFEGQSLITYIDGDVLKSLKQIGEKHDATLFMVIITCVKILLYRYTESEEIILGTPIAGRNHVDLENQIGFFINTLCIRTQINPKDNFLSLLAKIRETMLEAYEHKNYPFDRLVDNLDINYPKNRNAIFDAIIVLQKKEKDSNSNLNSFPLNEINILKRKTSIYDLKFEFEEEGEYLKFVIEYNTQIYDQFLIENFMQHYKEIVKSLLLNPLQKIRNLNFLTTDEINKLLNINNFADNHCLEGITIHKLFEKQVKERPNSIAILYKEESTTYGKLDFFSNKIGRFLLNQLGKNSKQKIGLLFDSSQEMIASILGTLKSGNAYVPLNPSFPEDRLKYIVRDTNMDILLISKPYIELANRLQWSTPLQSYLCIDSDDIYKEKEAYENIMMDQKLWEHVGMEAIDQITGGGWFSSYTGQPIPAIEMDEYAQNVYKKLKPLLTHDIRVLEIGCSSGLTLFKIAPEVAYYQGTDLSSEILKNTQKIIDEVGLKNVFLEHRAAIEIDQILEGDFDLIIINSVIQHFHGHSHLIKVIEKAINLLKDKGHLFIGDIMDIEQKEALILDIKKYQNLHKEARGKTDFSADLFISKKFLKDLRHDKPEILAVDISEKIHTIQNELTKFRFDALFTIDKIHLSKPNDERSKFQYDYTDIKKLSGAKLEVEVLPSDLAYIIYTSGTTGTPKGVKISHDNVVRLFVHDACLFDFNSEDTWSLFHLYSFDFSVWEIFGALLFGGKLAIVPKLIAQDSYEFIKMLEEHQVTVLNQTPSAFYELLQQENLKNVALNIRYVIFGGEALNPSKIALWSTYFPKSKLINMYGITETTVHSTYKELKPEDLLLSTSNIGKALPTVSCYVLNEDLKPCPVGVSGELFVGGSGLAAGYLNNDKLTNTKFIEHPFKPGKRLYRSGDKVRLLKNGEFEYLGRLDTQVKIRGYRIELGEVQRAVYSSLAVKSVVIMSVKNKKEENELVAYIVPEDNHLDIALLKAYLKEELPSYMIPTHYVPLEKFPLTSNGKLDKNAFPSPYLYDKSEKNTYKAPVTDLEKQLVLMWEEILDRTPIGMTDDFFELGGHSLKATRLLNVYRNVLETDVKLKDLFLNTTPASHVTLLTKAENKVWDTIKPISNQELYSISSSQRMLWIICQFKQASVAYNIPHVFPINTYHLSIFKTAFDSVIQRHEILRTVFKQQENGDVTQQVIPFDTFSFEIEHIDYSSKANGNTLLQEFVKSDSMKPFDLEHGPLLRAYVIKVSDNEQFGYFNMHHIISDGWSMDILFRDVMEFYNALLEDRNPSLPDLSIQYKDYANWQQEYLNGTIRNNDRAYWLSQFSDNLPVFELVYSKNRPKLKTYNGDRYSVFIPSSKMENINSFVRTHNGTLFMGLMSTLKVLLYKYTGQRDMIIGSPIGGRDHLDLKDQVGFYVNTLAIRSFVDNEDNFLSYFEALKNKLLNAYNHQRYPFDTMVEELSLPIDTSRSPVFDIMMVFHNTQQDVASGEISENYRVGTIEKDTTSKFDLLFDFKQYKDGVLLQLEYNNDIYDRDIIAQFVSHYIHLLTYAPTNSEVLLNQLPYLQASDMDQLTLFNNTKTDIEDATVVRMFTDQVDKTPDSPAVLFGDRIVSYQQVEDKSNQLAHMLIEKHRVTTGDCVGVVLSRSHLSVITMIAVLKAGACYTPIDPEYPEQRLSYICEDATLSLIITEASCVEVLSNIDVQTTLVNDTILDKYSKESVDKSNIHQASYVIYTSGSTGKPKGVLQTHKMLSNLIFWNINASGIDPGLRYLQYASFSFDVSLNDVFFTLCSAGSVYVCSDAERLNYDLIKDVIIDKSIEVLSFPYAALINFFQKHDPFSFSNHSIKHIVSTAEQLYIWGSLQSFLENNSNVFLHNHYGPSESHVVTSHTMSHTMGNLVYRPSIGKPICNSSIFIVDDYMMPVGIGIKGELYIGGSNLAKGYLNLPDQTRDRFIQNPSNPDEILYKTGDFGFWKNDGTIEYLGRGDGQVKIRGYRIELEDVVANLVCLEEIDDAIVLTKTHLSENHLCAYIVTSKAIETREIMHKLRKILPSYMIPSFFVKLDSLPLTANGKLNESLLPSFFAEGEGSKQYIAPRNPKEKKLVAIWEELLGREKIGVNENFFELGGHSLKAIKLINDVNKLYNTSFQFIHLFDAPTIAEFASLIEIFNEGLNKIEDFDEVTI